VGAKTESLQRGIRRLYARIERQTGFSLAARTDLAPHGRIPDGHFDPAPAPAPEPASEPEPEPGLLTQGVLGS
jgi:hypothetical protein